MSSEQCFVGACRFLKRKWVLPKKEGASGCFLKRKALVAASSKGRRQWLLPYYFVTVKGARASTSSPNICSNSDPACSNSAPIPAAFDVLGRAVLSATLDAGRAVLCFGSATCCRRRGWRCCAAGLGWVRLGQVGMASVSSGYGRVAGAGVVLLTSVELGKYYLRR